jgi:hypothetical protein
MKKLLAPAAVGEAGTGLVLLIYPSIVVRLLFAAEIAGHLAFAHEQKFIHQDVKPGNILLDGRGEPLFCARRMGCGRRPVTHD